MRFKGIKLLLGLCFVALGVMAIGAAAVQASTWLVNGKAITSPLKPEVQVVELESKSVLLTKVGLSKLEIECTSLEFTDALLGEAGTGSVKALSLIGCKLLLNGAVQKQCAPSSPDTAEGSGNITILNLVGKFTQVTPEGGAGKSFVQINFPKACSLTATEITGVIEFKDCEGKLSTDQILHLFVEGGSMKYGTNPMTLEGGVTVALAGAHKGMTWAGH